MRCRSFLWPILLWLSLAPAHAETDAGLLGLRALDRRVASVAFRLATSSAELCYRQQKWPGLVLHNVDQYAPALRAAVRATFRLSDAYPAFLAVVPDGPAARAGIGEDEALRAINGVELLPSPLPRHADYTALDAVLTRFEDALAEGPSQLLVGAGTTQRVVTLAGEAGCQSRVELNPSRRLAAASDGKIVEITGALASFADSDDQLAFILAHEMAHNVLLHADRLRLAGIRGGLGSAIGRKAARIRESEEEADYLAIYFLARAGYDVGAVPAFWVRFRRHHHSGLLAATTHPSWRQRLRQAEATIAEITARRAAGQPLVPNAARFRADFR